MMISLLSFAKVDCKGVLFVVLSVPLSILSFQELGAVSLDGYFHLWKAEHNLCKVKQSKNVANKYHVTVCGNVHLSRSGYNLLKAILKHFYHYSTVLLCSKLTVCFTTDTVH